MHVTISLGYTGTLRRGIRLDDVDIIFVIKTNRRKEARRGIAIASLPSSIDSLSLSPAKTLFANVNALPDNLTPNPRIATGEESDTCSACAPSAEKLGNANTMYVVEL